MFHFVINAIISIKLFTSLTKMIFPGFYLNPGVTGSWSAGKSACEGMGMQLASLKSAALHEAAIKYINVQQSSG